MENARTRAISYGEFPARGDQMICWGSCNDVTKQNKKGQNPSPSLWFSSNITSAPINSILPISERIFFIFDCLLCRPQHPILNNVQELLNYFLMEDMTTLVMIQLSCLKTDKYDSNSEHR